MAFWRRIWQRDGEGSLAACTALDVGTEFAKALVFEIDETGHGTVRGVGRRRQGLSHMQSGTVADIAAVVDNCAVALQEAEEMAGFRPSQVVIGIAGELVKGFTTTHTQERKRPDQPITESELQKLIDGVQRAALREAERAITWETGLPHVDVRLPAMADYACVLPGTERIGPRTSGCGADDGDAFYRTCLAVIRMAAEPGAPVRRTSHRLEDPRSRPRTMVREHGLDSQCRPVNAAGRPRGTLRFSGTGFFGGPALRCASPRL